MIRWFFALIMMLVSIQALAVYDILLENNTPYKLYIHTGTKNTDLPDSAYGGWHHQVMLPYEREKVQWFNFDKHISFNKNYSFYVEARLNAVDKEPLMTFETDIKGFLIGSSIQKSSVITAEGKVDLIKGEPKPHFSVLRETLLSNTLHDSHRLHVRADAIKYTVPNPHKNIQLTDAISYVITEDQPQYHHQKESDELTLLSYNIQVFPFIGNMTDAVIMNHPEERIKEIAKKVKDYDVVTVQELFARDHLKSFTKLMKENYPWHVGPVRDYRPFSSGVVIYSRWPVLDSGMIIYKACSKIDCGAAKGVSYAKIEKNGKRYNIFSTHFQAGTTEPGDEVDANGNRYQQILAMSEYIRSKRIPKDEAVIITGDFNIDAAACYDHEECNEFNNLIEAFDAKYIKHDNRKVMPYSVNSFLNWMTGRRNLANKKVLDYIMPLNGYRDIKSYHSRVLVLRGDDDSTMYIGEPYGDTDLSDHFAIEAKLNF